MQTIYVTGTHCSACKKLIERKLSAIGDVDNVEVDYESGKTMITSNRTIDKEEISKALEGMPYEQKD